MKVQVRQYVHIKVCLPKIISFIIGHDGKNTGTIPFSNGSDGWYTILFSNSNNRQDKTRAINDRVS